MRRQNPNQGDKNWKNESRIMNNRIKKILEHVKLSQKDFAALTGISPATLSQILSGKQAATIKTVDAIHTTFPDINLDWLMFGKGEMIPVAQDQTSAPAISGGTPAESVQPLEHGVTNQNPIYSTENFGRQNEKPKINDRAGDVKKADTPRRYITEIRVFYSDGTYESFAGNKH